jgi:prepilin peptidase CpaA
MLFDIVLSIILVVCFITDFRQQKIYNIVIYPSICIALIMNIVFSGLEGLKFSLLGLATGFAILLIPYLLGGMGAGDVKLLSFIGAIKGSVFVLNSAVYMALLGGMISLVLIISNKQTKSFFKSFASWIASIFRGLSYKIEFSSSGFSSVKFPYGTAIVLGAFICLFFKGAWII